MCVCGGGGGERKEGAVRKRQSFSLTYHWRQSAVCYYHYNTENIHFIQSINQFIKVNAWDYKVALSIRAKGLCIKRMTKIKIRDKIK